MKSLSTKAWKKPVALFVAAIFAVGGVITQTPLTAANAADELGQHTPNQLITLSNLRLTRATGLDFSEATGPLVYDGQARFSLEWSAVDALNQGKLKVGDSFTVTLPSIFNVHQLAPFDFKGQGENPLGRCYPKTVIVSGDRVSSITCKFTDALQAALDKGDVHPAGTLFAGMKVVKESGVDVTFNLNGTEQLMQLPDNKPVVRPKKTWKSEPFYKSSDGVNQNPKEKEMRWYYSFTGDKLKEAFGGNVPDVITFKDTLTGDHVFHNNDYELYIAQTKENPDMTTKEWITVATNTTRRDGEGPIDSTNFGTFEVTPTYSDDRKTATFTIKKIAGEWNSDARYKFLYRTRSLGTKVEGITYSNTVEVAEFGKEPIPALTKSASNTYVLSAGATITMEPGFGTFRIIKNNLTIDPQLPEDTKVTVNVAWELPSGNTPTNYPGWNPPANPLRMEIPLNQATTYTPAQAGKPFPIGTTLTITEDISTPALPNGLTWNAPTYRSGGVESKTSAVLTVAAKPVAAEIANSLMIPSVSVGDFVWWDKNKNGQQDNGEPGIPNVKLALTITDDPAAEGKPVGNVYGMRVAPATTDHNGKYSFNNLPVLTGNKKYKVTLDPSTVPAEYTPTVAEKAGVDTALNSNTGSVTSTAPLNVDKANDPTLDFGFVKKSVSVGNFVWHDLNRNGLQDPNEPGLDGVVLRVTKGDQPVTDVLGQPVNDVTTNAQGEYKFENLPALAAGENYKVTVVTPPAGFIATKVVATPADKNSSDGFALSEQPLTDDGAEDMTLDFGFHKPAVSVGNFVWHDQNRDGLQDPNEPGLDGVVLRLTLDDQAVTDVLGQPVADVTTSNNGAYKFENLPVLTGDKKYKVTVVTPPEGFVATKVVADPKDKNSSDGSALSELPLTTHGAEDMTLDFGFHKPVVSVGDYVWLDSNRNGAQDTEEKGIQGVVLGLTYADGTAVTDVLGNAVTDQTTGPNGEYTFDNLPVLTGGKKYKVTVKTAPPGLVPTKELAEGVGADKNSNTESVVSEHKLDANGDNDPTLDFGFMAPSVSVGDFVWWDKDKNGQQDADEPGIPNVRLSLTDSDGNTVTDVLGVEVAPTTTNQDGKYSFENLPILPAGKFYKVTLDTATVPAEYTPTEAEKANVDPALNSNTGSVTSTEALNTDKAKDLTLDFGFIKKNVSVGDYVWLDSNRNGAQDADEKGIQGVVVALTYADGSDVTDVLGNKVEPQTTGPNGEYSFENLPVLTGTNKYKVTVKVGPQGLVPTKPEAEGVGVDKNSNTGSAESVKDLTTHGANDPTLDFGFMTPAVSVGDFVWHDLNRDGKQDPGEPGLAGVVLTLTKDGQPVTDVFGNQVGEATTGTNGEYAFENLPTLSAGEKYKVSVKTGPEGFIPTVAEADGVSVEENSNTDEALSEKDLSAHEANDPTLDFGFVKPFVTVGDFVWHDVNQNGAQDKDEPGLPGVLMELTYANGDPVTDIDGNPVKPVATGDKGEYVFTKLPVLKDDQQYKVSVKEHPEGYISTIPLAPGVSEELNSNTGSVVSKEALDVHGASDMSLDFGFYKPSVTVGDFVWHDTNRNGKQDKDEPGIKGVELKIVDPHGKPVVDIDGKPVPNVLTDASGLYSFTRLPILKPGEKYTVSVVKNPAGYEPTVASANGTTTANDSSTGSAASGDLVKDGDKDTTLDFGFVKIPTKGGKIARTGAEAGPIVGFVLLFAAGGALVLGARRRRK